MFALPNNEKIGFVFIISVNVLMLKAHIRRCGLSVCLPALQIWRTPADLFSKWTPGPTKQRSTHAITLSINRQHKRHETVSD